jgi:hypothetical protein
MDLPDDTAPPVRLEDFVQRSSQDLSVLLEAVPPPPLIASAPGSPVHETVPRALPEVSAVELKPEQPVAATVPSANYTTTVTASSSSTFSPTPPSGSPATARSRTTKSYNTPKSRFASTLSDEDAEGGQVADSTDDFFGNKEELKRVRKLAQLLGADTDKDIKDLRRKLKSLCMLMNDNNMVKCNIIIFTLVSLDL